MLVVSKIKISEIEIYPVRPRGGLVGYASCIVNDAFYIGCIGIHTRPNGEDFRLTFPTKTLPNGAQVGCVHPIRRDVGESMRRQIVEKFLEISAKLSNHSRCNERAKVDCKFNKHSLQHT
jgi:stage V sporulation protein G